MTLTRQPYMETIIKDRQLCDGTPRRENGYRVFRQWNIDLERQNSRIRSSVFQSPLFRTEREARIWYPSVELISAHFGFAP